MMIYYGEAMTTERSDLREFVSGAQRGGWFEGGTRYIIQGHRKEIEEM